MKNYNNKINSEIGPKDVFMHLFAMAMLYICAIDFLILSFQYINILIPDLLDSQAYYDGYYRQMVSYGPLRFAIASLIVVFPIYILATWFLNRGYEENPLKRNMKIRKWLIYFTLFIAALVIIGDLISLLFRFLEGEIALRFILKVLAVFFVACSVFIYYLWEIKKFEDKQLKTRFSKPIKLFQYIVVLTTTAIIIIGFFITGSPKQARIIQLDQKRIQDLQFIQQEIVNYWINKAELPTSLSQIKDDIRGLILPRDPETKEEYQYQKTDILSFKLCANFAKESPNYQQDQSITAPKYPIGPGFIEQINWRHPQGFFCFERTIDKDYYKPIPKRD